MLNRLWLMVGTDGKPELTVGLFDKRDAEIFFIGIILGFILGCSITWFIIEIKTALKKIREEKKQKQDPDENDENEGE